MKNFPITPLNSASALDAEIIIETPDMFLARGGCITKCPPKTAQAPMMYTPVIAVDGYTVPLGTVADEYIPNFVRDISTYDIAQDDPVTVEDDGSASVVREDLERNMRSTVSWRNRVNYVLRHEDADVMEELS